MNPIIHTDYVLDSLHPDSQYTSSPIRGIWIAACICIPIWIGVCVLIWAFMGNLRANH